MRWLVAPVALLMLAGCGGGSAPDDDTPTTTPAPQTYTPKQLEAALPEAGDIPGGTRIGVRCPQDAEACTTYPQGTVAVTAHVDPASPVGAEQVQDPATPIDFVAVQARRQADAAAASDAIKDARSFNEPYEGEFDLPERKTDDGGIIRPARGKGSIDDVTIDGWTGVVARRTETSSRSKTDQGLLIATISLSSGRTSVTAFVSLSAAQREPDAAVDLADGLVRDYIERLG